MSRFTSAEFDSALSTASDSILPSSGFTASVMSAVQSEASASPAIAFPLVRALPGFAAYLAVIAMLIAVCVAGVRANNSQAPGDLSWQGLRVPILHDGSSTAIFWLILSMLIALLCLTLTQRLSKLH